MREGLRIAAFIGCAGLALLAALPLNAPLWAIVIAMILAGHGIGVCLIGSITSAQNALTAQDIGAGTGALLVLRSVGGASGSTLAGAIIDSGLTTIRQTADGAPALADAAGSGLAAGASISDGVSPWSLRRPLCLRRLRFSRHCECRIRHCANLLTLFRFLNRSMAINHRTIASTISYQTFSDALLRSQAGNAISMSHGSWSERIVLSTFVWKQDLGRGQVAGCLIGDSPP